MHGSTPSRLVMVVGVLLCCCAVVPTARAKDNATTASQVFTAASPSIVVVKAIDENGKELALGSGVVVDKGVVVSNCHVFELEGTEVASVIYHGKSYVATLRYADVAHDLCSFTINDLAAPPVQMRNASTLTVGENVYAIGAPEGLSLTLSNGIVSSLRKVPDGTVIQTTAPISPGSSGGGLFDSQGQLIGITAFYMKGGQQLNFALPAEWIEALPQRGKTPKELASRKPKTQADFQKGVKAYWNGDYATALSIYKALAKKGHEEAQVRLAWMYGNGEGVPRDYSKALYWYHEAAAQGNAAAQSNLGSIYNNGAGVRQDYSKALHWYRKAAVQGFATAQNNLGAMYHGGKGVPQDYAKALDWYRKAAAQGNAFAQYNLGLMYGKGDGVPQNYSKAVYWYRKAGAQGNIGAQNNLGGMYYDGAGVPQNYAKAVDWYRKAATQGDATAQYNLGVMYRNGKGVPQNHSIALDWYRKAAAQGDAASQVALASMNFLGHGLPQNYAQAAKWLILAKAGGHRNAGEMLTALEKKMTSAQIAEAQRLANQWWEAHQR